MREKVKKKTTVNASEVQDALIKKALGYDVTEVVEEYVGSDQGEIKLSKKKVTKQNVPPDMTALKILLDQNEQPPERMSDEQLQKEKMRLLELLEKYRKKE